jgi:AcrR family transcriptional regulator
MEEWPPYSRPDARTARAGGTRDVRSARQARREADVDRRAAMHVRRAAQRGKQPPLSAEEVVRVAIAVADAEGAEAISMRRIARELGAGVMSLYWYVTSKEELLNLMLDALEAEVALPEPSGDWRHDMRAAACAERGLLRKHPWVVNFLAGRAPGGPNALQNIERNLAYLADLDIDARVAMGILGSIGTYVMGAVLREVQELRGAQEDQEREAEMTADEVIAEHKEVEEWFNSSGRYPHLIAIFSEGLDPDSPDTQDERFEFGLDCLLDGIAARLPSPRQ